MDLDEHGMSDEERWTRKGKMKKEKTQIDPQIMLLIDIILQELEGDLLLPIVFLCIAPPLPYSY